MQPTQKLDDTMPAIVHLGLGATTLVLGVHLIFAGLRNLLDLWVALTPNQDREWNFSRSRS